MAKQFLTLIATTVMTAALAAQAPALRIVVIEGESAVNIIQQKTAVRAVVEVRDRNNLPVPGATVTFALGGQGGATVAGGAASLTVTTNVEGQAALAGVTPASAGNLQISVAASFKDLTASATISQTNVATAAAVMAAASAGAIAGGGGGGLSSGAVIGIVGGAGAIGGGLAVLGGGASGDDQSGTTTGSTQPATPGATPLPTCIFAASPTLLTVPISGGTYGITVTMSPAACANSAWQVTNVPNFVSVDRMSGTGNGSVTIAVAPFAPAENFPARTGAISIGGVVVEIHQPRALSAAP